MVFLQPGQLVRQEATGLQQELFLKILVTAEELLLAGFQ